MKEAKSLLKHPDSRERALALKLNSVTPQDIAVGILDPNELVWKTAFYHPNSSHALDVLACMSRDAAGDSLHKRHNLLLQDPRCTPEHVDNIKRALQQDTYLPVVIQNERLRTVEQLGSLVKKEPVTEYLEHSTDPLEKKIKVSEEPVKHPELAASYAKSEPISDELANKGAFQKAIRQHKGNGVNNKFIIKPYYEDQNHLGGWAEASSQHLYHAAGIGHLHQKSFIGDYNNGNQHIPATIIHVEKAKPIIHTDDDTLAKNPNVKEDAQKIAIMDFLTGNNDRHNGNLMVKDDGQLLAIDHGLGFSYHGDPYNTELYTPSQKNANHFGKYTVKSGIRAIIPGVSKDKLTDDTVNYHNTIKQWWPTVASDVRRAFNERLKLISNPTLKKHMELGFNARLDWLNKAATINPDELLTELRKVVQQYDEEPVIEPEHEDASRYATVHGELLNTHPKEFQDSVDTFEKYINHPTNLVKPEMGSLEGIESKALVKHGDKKYLIKAASTYLAPLSGWAEMTSQAMYHAGGIGHLHQQVHATHLNIKDGNSYRKQPAIVIHFKPGKWNSFRDSNERNPEYDNDIRKVYLMDFLTGNSDRHSGNMLVEDSTGQPQVIDDSFAFRRDPNDNPEDQNIDRHDWFKFAKKLDPNTAPFNYGLFAGTNELNYRGYLPNEDTWNWWNQNKNNIVAAFDKNLQMIPNKEERAKRKAYFDFRVKDTDARHPLIFSSSALSKALGNTGFLHDQHSYETFPLQQGLKADVTGVHEKLMQAHPAAVNPGVRHFELALNNPKSLIKPTKQQDELDGLQAKALYHHNGKGYLIKPATENTTALGAWNELTSQALYHTAGIGHLHQKVHATVAKTGLNRTEPAHALAIHMEDDAMPWGDAYGHYDKYGYNPPKDSARAEKTLKTPEHRQSLKKIGLMDYLTSNLDAHHFNTVIKPDGSPISIDHSRAFYSDRKHAYGDEVSNELKDENKNFETDPEYQNRVLPNLADFNKYSNSVFHGGLPDEDTWQWWDGNKQAMLQKFKDHVAMLPDAEAKQKMVNSFTSRFNNIERLRKEFAGQNNQNSIQSAQPKTTNVSSNPNSSAGFEQTLADRTEPSQQKLAG